MNKNHDKGIISNSIAEGIHSFSFGFIKNFKNKLQKLL